MVIQMYLVIHIASHLHDICQNISLLFMPQYSICSRYVTTYNGPSKHTHLLPVMLNYAGNACDAGNLVIFRGNGKVNYAKCGLWNFENV